MAKSQKILIKFKSELLKCFKIEDVNNLKSKYLGGKGIISKDFLSQIKTADYKRKKEIGKYINEIKLNINELCKNKICEIKKELLNISYKNDEQNYFIKNLYTNYGSKHPLNIIKDEIISFFSAMNFSNYEYNEIDSSEYNFDRLNIGINHVSRNSNDTFFLNNNSILRTHCTNFTSYYLTKFLKNANINNKAICIGNVYRRDTHDSTHTHQFMQIDGFCIGNYDIGNLKFLLKEFIFHLLGNNIKIKFRPSYFPFTSPSLEVDIECYKCNGNGCALCKHFGWIEVLGAGILHNKVIETAKLDSEKVSGIAFGIGLERLAMIKYKISDIRLFYNNNLKFLVQFKGM